LAAASSDGGGQGSTGDRGPPTILDFLVINFSVCLVLLSNCYIIIYQHGFCNSLVNSLILNAFSIRFVVLLASDRLARSSKFLLISASYLLF